MIRLHLEGEVHSRRTLCGVKEDLNSKGSGLTGEVGEGANLRKPKKIIITLLTYSFHTALSRKFILLHAHDLSSCYLMIACLTLLGLSY
jgi:hypothetical protein